MKLPLRTTLTLPLAALTVLASGLLAAPAQARTPDSSAASAASAASGRAASYAVPSVGSCHAYTARQADRRTETSAPVDCATPHTGLTVAVLTVRSVRSDKAVDRGARKCVKAAARAVGSALPRTAYGSRFFLPTRAEAKQGARWLRCDVVLSQGRDLAPLPATVSGAPTDASALCAVTVKKKTVKTTCAAEHDYRYAAHYRAKAKKYPGEDALLRSVILTCAKKVSTPKRFWAFYPTAFEWRAGQRQVSCLSRSRA